MFQAHVQRIMQLPVVCGKNPNKLYDFYEKLSHGTLKGISEYVQMSLDKIQQVRPNLVMLGVKERYKQTVRNGRHLILWLLQGKRA